MKIFISYPPLESDKGIPLLSQNRQFQWFNDPTFIYPMVSASAATLLQHKDYTVIWDDAVAERKTYVQWKKDVEIEKPDMIVMETKTPVVKMHWKILKDIKEVLPDTRLVLMGDHVTALPKESLLKFEVKYLFSR